MTQLTQRQANVEKEFFSDKNTKLDFRNYDVTGGDRQLLEDVCMRLLGQYNADPREAVYSFPCKEDGEFEAEHGYGNVKDLHEKNRLRWYDITDKGITKKLPGVESGFYSV